MDVFGEEGTLHYQYFGLGDPAGVTPSDLLFAAAAAAGRSHSGSQIADAARDFGEWARIDPDIYTLSNGHANGGGSHHGGTDEGDTGTISTATEPQPETIVVTGKRLSGTYGVQFEGSYGGGDVVNPEGDSDSITPGGDEPQLTDEQEVTVTVNIENPTDEQKKAVNDYLKAIDRLDKAIRSIPDNKKVTLYDGSTVTGAELKALWLKMDFVINPDTVFYDGQNRGAAMYNGGDPIVYMNITNLVDYNAHGESGMNFLVGHELGHLTAANRFHDGTNTDAGARYEQMANDISRAIAFSAGIDVLPQTNEFENDAYERYSTANPLVFTAE